jgi:hypothetical protein
MFSIRLVHLWPRYMIQRFELSRDGLGMKLETRGIHCCLRHRSESPHLRPFLDFWSSPAPDYNLSCGPIYGNIFLLSSLLIFRELLKPQRRSYIALQSMQITGKLSHCCEVFVATGFGQVIYRNVPRARPADAVGKYGIRLWAVRRMLFYRGRIRKERRLYGIGTFECGALWKVISSVSEMRVVGLTLLPDCLLLPPM